MSINIKEKYPELYVALVDATERRLDLYPPEEGQEVSYKAIPSLFSGWESCRKLYEKHGIKHMGSYTNHLGTYSMIELKGKLYTVDWCLDLQGNCDGSAAAASIKRFVEV